MKLPTLTLLALLLAAPACAQDPVRLPGRYNCLGGVDFQGDRVCGVSCPGFVDLIRVEDSPAGRICEGAADDQFKYDECEETLGTPYCIGHTEESLRSSVAPPPENKRGENALIAGAAALTGVILARTLLPELPEGASFRPHANVDFRDGSAFTAANVTAEWRNFRVSASSSHNGYGWARPSGRLDWRVEWAF